MWVRAFIEPQSLQNMRQHRLNMVIVTLYPLDEVSQNDTVSYSEDKEKQGTSILFTLSFYSLKQYVIAFLYSIGLTL